MKFILGRNIPYRPQWDNKLFPSTTCNTTSMVHALEIANIPFSCPANEQPEDYLTSILESKEAFTLMAKLYRWAVGSYHPRHVHGMLSWAVNEKLVKKDVTFFTTKAHIKDIIFHMVVSRTPVVTGGKFTPYGHIVTVVGFDSDQPLEEIVSPNLVELRRIKSIIINDSWGNYFTGYKNRNGYNIEFPYHTFISIANEIGREDRRWAHFFYTDGVPHYLAHLPRE